MAAAGNGDSTEVVNDLDLTKTVLSDLEDSTGSLDYLNCRKSPDGESNVSGQCLNVSFVSRRDICTEQGEGDANQVAQTVLKRTPPSTAHSSMNQSVTSKPEFDATVEEMILYEMIGENYDEVVDVETLTKEEKIDLQENLTSKKSLKERFAQRIGLKLNLEEKRSPSHTRNLSPSPKVTPRVRLPWMIPSPIPGRELASSSIEPLQRIKSKTRDSNKGSFASLQPGFVTPVKNQVETNLPRYLVSPLRRGQVSSPVADYLKNNPAPPLIRNVKAKEASKPLESAMIELEIRTDHKIQTSSMTCPLPTNTRKEVQFGDHIEYKYYH